MNWIKQEIQGLQTALYDGAAAKTVPVGLEDGI